MATVLLALGLIGCTPGELTETSPESARADQTSPTAPAATRETPSGGAEAASPVPETGGSAAELLATLPVKGRAPLIGYDRDAFAWRADADRNGCDTRNDILARDLTDPTFRAGTGDCVVLTGLLHDPYIGDTVSFDRQRSTVDIDHVVALANAWQTGAAGWDAAKRVALANDPLNLLAVSATVDDWSRCGFCGALNAVRRLDWQAESVLRAKDWCHRIHGVSSPIQELNQ